MSNPRVLIISYFFSPDKKVGALRPSYWYNLLPKYTNWNVSVVTAEENAIGENVHIVPRTSELKPYHLIRDIGILWKKDLKRFFEEHHELKIDYLIITGSPFMHFGIGGWIKKRFGCKVILDYRDPFAKNPGFKNSGIKIKIKEFFEQRFNQKADGIVTVNKYCGDLIARFHDKANCIIQNGYDETFVPVLKPVNLRNPVISYTGKFYFDPKPILDVTIPLEIPFIYAGGDMEALSEYNTALVEGKGIIAYPDAVQLMADSDICIVQTYGEDFMSTTKIFDYIRCKRFILVVSNNHLERGSLFEELKGYPNVLWAKNDASSIAKAIDQIKNTEFIDDSEFNIEKHSRLGQMKKLIEFIKNL